MFVAPNLDFGRLLEKELKGHPAERCLLPDIVVRADGLEGDCRFGPTRMGEREFLHLASTLFGRCTRGNHQRLHVPPVLAVGSLWTRSSS